MFNLGFSELLLLGVIALVFIGPKQLPEVARSLGRLLNELKRASSDFQDTFTTPIKEDFMNRIEETRQQMSEGHGPEAVNEPKDMGPKIDQAEEDVPALPKGDGNT